MIKAGILKQLSISGFIVVIGFITAFLLAILLMHAGLSNASIANFNKHYNSTLLIWRIGCYLTIIFFAPNIMKYFGKNLTLEYENIAVNKVRWNIGLFFIVFELLIIEHGLVWIIQYFL